MLTSPPATSPLAPQALCPPPSGLSGPSPQVSSPGIIPLCSWPPQDLAPVTFSGKPVLTFSTTPFSWSLFPSHFCPQHFLTPGPLCAHLFSIIYHQNAVSKRARMFVHLAPHWLPSAYSRHYINIWWTSNVDHLGCTKYIKYFSLQDTWWVYPYTGSSMPRGSIFYSHFTLKDW